MTDGSLDQPYSSALDNWIVKAAPPWVRKRNELARETRIFMLQFSAPFMRPIEVWNELPLNVLGCCPLSADEIAAAVLAEAREKQNAHWPGTGKDLRVTGGAWWNGGQPIVTHAKDV